jgi:single-stranded-DNA-specific exonuclease
MGKKYKYWRPRSDAAPQGYTDLVKIVTENRKFSQIESLEYGDHGLEDAYAVIARGIRGGKKIALYADYDVDGTMSCISWIWFLQSINHHNFIYYIPDRFTEGYGVNLAAIQKLVREDGAEIIITMDTGITANVEAKWCLENGIEFICTDHHKIQKEKMPDCVILNPKMHPDPEYQELCGCGITFVLLRKLAKEFPPPPDVWTDILALTGMATICDVVPLNGVNHRLARYGVEALLRSKRPVLQKLLLAAAIDGEMDEKDVGFRLGPRINAVGRLEHAAKIIEAFIGDDPDFLIRHMGICNERRKLIQHEIVLEAIDVASTFAADPILFLGGDWHAGVVGIAASKLVEEFWRPVWLFQRKDGMCKGSARSLPGFDVTEAMISVGALFTKFGGHAAAGGYSFPEANEVQIRAGLIDYARKIQASQPEIWESNVAFDCYLPVDMAILELAECLEGMKPFGHGFEEPKFCIEAKIEQIAYYNDKKTGDRRHTAITVQGASGNPQKIMFFNRVYEEFNRGSQCKFIVTAGKNTWRGNTSLSLFGEDFEMSQHSSL